eukprot:6308836-Prymnesium_polylepis.1
MRTCARAPRAPSTHLVDAVSVLRAVACEVGAVRAEELVVPPLQQVGRERCRHLVHIDERPHTAAAAAAVAAVSTDTAAAAAGSSHHASRRRRRGLWRRRALWWRCALRWQ